MNYVTKTFLLVSSSIWSKQPQLCFVHSEDQKSKQKHTTENFFGFHNHFSRLTIIWLKGLMCPLFSMEAQSMQVENPLSNISAATNNKDFFLFPFAQCLLPP